MEGAGNTTAILSLLVESLRAHCVAYQVMLAAISA